MMGRASARRTSISRMRVESSASARIRTTNIIAYNLCYDVMNVLFVCVRLRVRAFVPVACDVSANGVLVERDFLVLQSRLLERYVCFGLLWICVEAFLQKELIRHSQYQFIARIFILGIELDHSLKIEQ